MIERFSNLFTNGMGISAEAIKIVLDEYGIVENRLELFELISLFLSTAMRVQKG